ncbi:MAG: helix-turn-helix transcriptional regulator [Promicromonosporaceae bacterium]|nr:helix-turn-helix transcriptional regulator [Promicromonosporaceae bacterium]
MPRNTPLDPELARALAERLKQLRWESGLTQEEVAHNAGLSRVMLQNYERGFSDRERKTPANPSLGTLVDLAWALDVDVKTLLADLPLKHTSAALPNPKRKTTSGAR